MVPVGDLDIWRTASELIKQHGEDAAVHAAMRTDKMLEKGDVEGAAVWKRIVRAIDALLTSGAPPGVSRHQSSLSY